MKTKERVMKIAKTLIAATAFIFSVAGLAMAQTEMKQNSGPNSTGGGPGMNQNAPPGSGTNGTTGGASTTNPAGGLGGSTSGSSSPAGPAGTGSGSIYTGAPGSSGGLVGSTGGASTGH
jgi:hypothetical protein